MPQFSRWFPVSHDINSDHEIWHMIEQIGPRSLNIWLELLSIGDRNQGMLPPMSEALASTLGHKCHATPTTVRRVWDYARTCLWIVSDPTPRLRNHLNYHRTRKPNKITNRKQLGSPLPNLPNLPNHPKIKNEEPASPEPTVDLKKKEAGKLPEAIKNAADPIYQSDPVKYRNLVKWLRGALSGRYPEPVIVAALTRFRPMAKDVENWWPYLDKIIDKEEARFNGNNAAVESARHKEEDRETANAVLRRYGLGKEAN